MRELENAIEQALVFAEGEEISPSALPQFLQGGAEEDRLDVPRELSLPEILDDLERQLILKAYAKAGRVKTETPGSPRSRKYVRARRRHLIA